MVSDWIVASWKRAGLDTSLFSGVCARRGGLSTANEAGFRRSSRGCNLDMRKRRRQGDTSSLRAPNYYMLHGSLQDCEGGAQKVPPGLEWDGSRRASRPAGRATHHNDSDLIGCDRCDPP